MNPVISFLVLALALLVIVLWVLGRLLWSGGRSASSSNDPQLLVRANIDVYRDQLAELERDWQSNGLSSIEYQQAREEINQRIWEELNPLMEQTPNTNPAVSASAPVASHKPKWQKTTLLAILIFVPVVSFSTYFWVGELAAIDGQALQAHANGEMDAKAIKDMVATLQERLDKDPTQVQDWLMLARVHRTQQRFDLADQAMQKALKLSDSPDLQIERAEILAMSHQGNFEGEPWEIINRVLQADPKHLGALFLAGSASYAHEQYEQALKYWERASVMVAADSVDRGPLDEALGVVRSKLGKSSAKAPGSEKITGRLSIAPELKNKVSPTDTVFIYATPVNGQRRPLAVLRTTVAALPLDFKLDDSLAMSPEFALSTVDQVNLLARVSKTGDAQSKNDDLGTIRKNIPIGTQGLKLTISGLLGQ